MKKILLVLTLALSVTSLAQLRPQPPGTRPGTGMGQGNNEYLKQQIINELDSAKFDIQNVINQMGYNNGHLRQQLMMAFNKIQNSQYNVQRISSNGNGNGYQSFYCVLKTTFDGNFSGTGSSELEARQNAYNACVRTTNNSFRCDQQTRGYECSRQ